jgi:hypothetical protein
MAFIHGKNAEVWLDAAAISAYLSSVALNVACDTADVTTFGKTFHVFIPGPASATVDAAGFFDDVFSTTPPTNIQNAGNVLTIGPGGLSTINQPARLVSAQETAYNETAPEDGAVAFTLGVKATDAVGFGFVLHTRSVDTGTTTGASLDGLAATATGWHAHLHVTAVSSGSWVVKLQDSADNSSWADVASGAFAAVTTGAAQRLSQGSPTAMRRYLRYVATVTGGSTPTITFGLAVSRN